VLRRAALTACPNCGKDVREDFAFCPFCEYPLKPFCPSCRREVQADYVRCPYCGFKLKGSTSAQVAFGQRPSLPIAFVMISFALLLTAIFNIGEGLNLATSDLSSYASTQPFPAGTQNELGVLVVLGVLLSILGLAQLVATYGLFARKPWSRSLTYAAAGVACLLYIGVLVLDTLVSGSYYSSPPWVELIPAYDTALLVWSLALLVAMRVYLERQYVEEILGFGYLPTVP
jgi:double zinc ribbon protein